MSELPPVDLPTFSSPGEPGRPADQPGAAVTLVSPPTTIELPEVGVTAPRLQTQKVQARLSGYSWDEINTHLADRTNEALSQGYTQREVDSHLGLPDPSLLQDTLRTSWLTRLADDPTLLDSFRGLPSAAPTPLEDMSFSRIADHAGVSALEPETQEEEPSPPSFSLATPSTRGDYADALISGQVRSPQDFAERTAGALLGGAAAVGAPLDGPAQTAVGRASAALASSLPSNEDTTDLAIALSLTNPELIPITHSNLLNLWAKTGQQPAESFKNAQTDPMMADALTKPPVEGSLPGPGFIPGDLHLDPTIAPPVPPNTPRPFAPGEWVTNPNGSWSSEMTMTVEGDPSFNEGQPTILPSLWLKQGRPYVAHNENEAVQLAKDSKLTFPPFLPLPNIPASPAERAEKSAEQREQGWQAMTPQQARNVLPLYIPDYHRDEILTGSVAGEPTEDSTMMSALEDLGIAFGTAYGGGLALRYGAKVVGSIVKSPAGQAVISGLGRLLNEEEGSLTIPLRAPITPAHIPIPGGIKPLMTGMEDDLNRLRTNATADKVEMGQWLDTLKPEWLDKDFQEEVSTEIEKKLLPPKKTDRLWYQGVRASAAEAKEQQSEYWTTDIEKAKAFGKREGNQGFIRIARESEIPENIRRRAGDDTLTALHSEPGQRATVVQLPEAGRLPLTATSKDAGKFLTETPTHITSFLSDMGVKRLTDRQTELAVAIRAKLQGPDVELQNGDMLGIKPIDEGYVRRVVKGRSDFSATPLDPTTEQNVITGGGGQRSISKWSPSNQPRQYYVLEDENGFRKFGEAPLSTITNPTLKPEEVGKPFKRQAATFGDRLADANGQEWTINPATMEEVEANTNTRYYKNFLANTVENVLRLERTNRNLDFLLGRGEELKDAGLFVPKTFGSVLPPPDASGMTRVELPGMDGWAAPRIANVLNDFYNRSGGDLDNFLTRSIRFVIGSLFISPIVHAGNVAAHWAVGRGWEWMTPKGTGSLMMNGARAVREVWTQGPRYVQHLREGSGLLYASTTTENFYNTVMHKLFREQLADDHTWGQFARSLGFSGVKHLVEVELKWSNKTLWAINDMFMLQRQFELEQRGRSIGRAILEAHKDIPPYRIPTEVMGSHVFSRFMHSPHFIVFGRYKYGQLSSLASLVTDLVGTQATGKERFDALGKLVVLGAIAYGVYPLLNAGIQNLTGTSNISARAFGPFGPIAAISGLMTGQKNWISAISSFQSLSPLIDLTDKIRNMDWRGKAIVDPHASRLGKVSETLEGALSEFYPGQLLLDLLKPNGVARVLTKLLGGTFNTPQDPNKAAKWQRFDDSMAAKREKSDEFEQLLGKALGVTQEPTTGARNRPLVLRHGGTNNPTVPRAAPTLRLRHQP